MTLIADPNPPLKQYIRPVIKSSEQYLLFRNAHIFEVGKFFNYFAIQDIKVGRGKIPRPTFMSVRAQKLAAPYLNVF